MNQVHYDSKGDLPTPAPCRLSYFLMDHSETPFYTLASHIARAAQCTVSMACESRGMAHHQNEKGADIRRRELAFAHWQAEITRGGTEPRTLANVVKRALADADVRADPALAAMIRDFARQRAKFLEEFKPTHVNQLTKTPVIQHEYGAAANVGHVATEEEVRIASDRLIRQFDEYAAHFFEPEAREICERLRALQARFSKWIPVAAVQHCDQTLARLSSRRQEYDNYILQLEQSGKAAAESGDHEAASRVVKRLSTIHATHPQLLTDDRLNEIRRGLAQSASIHEHRAALQELIERERAVIEELKSIARAVHRFHRMARTADHDGNEYRQAESEYHRAVQEVRTHDKEWLSALILELLEIIGEWAHPPPRIEAQLDKFVETVRASVKNLRREIIEIETEKLNPTQGQVDPSN